jgi:hypothetical protein
VTDPHLRAAQIDMITALADPSRDDRRIDADVARSASPSGQHLHLDGAVVGPEQPVRATLDDGEARGADRAASGPSAIPNPLSVRWWRLTASIISLS